MLILYIAYRYPKKSQEKKGASKKVFSGKVEETFVVVHIAAYRGFKEGSANYAPVGFATV
jgi:hypothetical protein